MGTESPWPTKEEWIKYGIDQGYEEKNSKSLQQSNDDSEKSWYNRGSTKKWLKSFSFNNLVKKESVEIYNLETKEDWIQYGIKEGYEDRNSNSISESKNSSERAWYNKGSKNKWLSYFKFNNLYSNEIISIKDLNDWLSFGYSHGYDKRGSRELSLSEDSLERGWYRKGQRNKWLTDFNFNGNSFPELKKIKDINDWILFGTENGYDTRNANDLKKSAIDIERAWYSKGARNKWLASFEFNGLFYKEIREIKTIEDWINFGLIQSYENKSPIDLQKSENGLERSWYSKGNRNKWLPDFPFNYKYDLKNDNSELENLLQDYAGGKE